jgi:hypothetical protein
MSFYELPDSMINKPFTIGQHTYKIEDCFGLMVTRLRDDQYWFYCSITVISENLIEFYLYFFGQRAIKNFTVNELQTLINNYQPTN